MNIQVTSVSKKQQSLSHSPAAVFVITQADIVQSGATNIPDLLRMVPGLDVAQIDGNTWAVSARGLNGRFSNELLVLLDGRSVYTPTTGGVFWDTLDMPLQDIDRIEVIRGPGGATWGANAVNGVVNIISKNAADTTGGLVEGGAGSIDQGFGTLQYGDRLSRSTTYRVYAKYFNDDELPGLAGEPGDDGWHILRGGFRTDTTLSAKSSLTFEGSLYSGREGQQQPFLPSITSPGPEILDTEVNLAGGFAQGIWRHQFSDSSSTLLQVSYDTYERDDILGEGRNTFDFDFQHHIAPRSRHDVVWGIDYRYSISHSTNSLFVSLNPAARSFQFFSTFVQDEIALVPDRAYLTLGTKVEHDFATGLNLMPTGRITWILSPNQSVWGAVSRAVRTPAENDTNIRLNVGGFVASDGTPTLVSIFGNPHLKGETLVAYEAGYRASVRHDLSLDLAAFYNRYGRQETTEPEAPFFESTPAPAHEVLPSTYENLSHGESRGAEAFADWNPTPRWKLSSGYAFLRVRIRLDPSSQDPDAVSGADGSSPLHSAELLSHFDVGRGLAWNASAYFVDHILDPQVPSYTRVDTSLVWRWKEKLIFTLAGQNLVRTSHLEFIDSEDSTNSTLARRSAYAKLDWQF